MLITYLNISCDPTGYSRKISTAGVEWGSRMNIWIVSHMSLTCVSFHSNEVKNGQRGYC